MTASGWGLVLMAAAGLLVGSFLNVCIHRLPRRESLVSPGSHCPSCGTRLRWLDNVPILSYLLLAGRCRTCHTPIPATYPIVELVTGVLFATLYASIGSGPLLISRLVFCSAMLVLLVIDLEHRLLPNAITIPGILVGFLLSFLGPPGWFSSMMGVLAGGAIPLMMANLYLWIRGEEGLGMGDVKMLAMIGAFLGWQLMLVTLFVASLVGSVVGVGLIVFAGKDRSFPIPFGSFLALAAVLASLAGESLKAWWFPPC